MNNIMRFIKKIKDRSYYYNLIRTPSGEYTLEFFYMIDGSTDRHFNRSPVGESNAEAFVLLKPFKEYIIQNLEKLEYPNLLIRYIDKDTIRVYDLILKSIGYTLLKENNDIRIYGGKQIG